MKPVAWQSSNPSGWRSRGYVPHFDGENIPQFITYRLANSIPAKLQRRWRGELAHLPDDKAEAEIRNRISECLDSGLGEVWLKDPAIAKIVEENLLRFDGERYALHSWVVMPNHVHVLITPNDGVLLSGILHGWKSYTAHRANRALGRSGPFWHREYWDRYTRERSHFDAVVRYIERNPVKAKLCPRPEDWRYGSARRRVGKAQ